MFFSVLLLLKQGLSIRTVSTMKLVSICSQQPGFPQIDLFERREMGKSATSVYLTLFPQLLIIRHLICLASFTSDYADLCRYAWFPLFAVFIFLCSTDRNLDTPTGLKHHSWPHNGSKRSCLEGKQVWNRITPRNYPLFHDKRIRSTQLTTSN